MHTKTGKEIRRLVGIDRLKKTDTMTDAAKTSSIETTQQPTSTASIKRKQTCEEYTVQKNDTRSTNTVDRSSRCHFCGAANNFFEGVRILTHRHMNRRRHYLVLRTNNTVQWCYHVGPALLEDYKDRRKFQR